MPGLLLKGRTFGQLCGIASGRLGRGFRQIRLPIIRGTTQPLTRRWLNRYELLAWPLREKQARTILRRHPKEHPAILSEADAAVEGWTQVSGFGGRRIELVPPEQGTPEDLYGYRLMSRLDFLRPICQAYLVTGREGYLNGLNRLLLDWSLVRCSRRGWDTVDDAIRILNLLETLALLQAKLSPDSLRAGLLAVISSAWNIEERRARTGNHLIYEGLALLAAGIVLHHHPRARSWRKLGTQILTAEMEQQVRSDGMNGELCTNYHLITGTKFLKGQILAISQGQGFPDNYLHRLALMSAVAGQLQTQDGGFIALGDSDRQAGTSREEREAKAFAQLGQAQMRTSPEARESATLDQEWLLAGTDSRRLHLPDYQNHQNAGDFGGYSLRREPDGSLLIFDAGPFGLPGASHHGHADALSFEVHLPGTRFLVDPGGFSYVDHAVRAFARSTAAHNTLRLDGLDSSAISGSFQFGASAQARSLEVKATYGGYLFSGEHNGYAPVIHRRHVFWIPGPPLRLLVIDRLLGTGRHTAEVFHHGEAGWQAQEADEGRIVWQKDQHRLVQMAWSSIPGETRIVEGTTDPSRQGWVSKAYGEYLPAPVSIFQCSGELPVNMVTVFVETTGDGQDLYLDGITGVLAIGRGEHYHWKWQGDSLNIVIE